MSTVRLFAALRPPNATLDDLAALVDTLATSRAGARLSASEGWHVTLAFLGEVDAWRLDDVTAALATATAEVAAPIRLRVAGGGVFGRGRSTVLWAGVTGATPDDTIGLTALADSTRTALRRADLPFSATPFRPHLTLAKPGDRVPGTQLAADLAALDAHTGPVFTVTSVVLYGSDHGYTVLHETPLPG